MARGAADLGAATPGTSTSSPACQGFDADPVGALPASWTVNGGTWSVIAASSHHALVQTESVSARIIAWTASPSDDIRWSVVVHPSSDHSIVCATARASAQSRYFLCLSDGSSWTLERDQGSDHTTLDSGSRKYDSGSDHTLVLATDGSKLTGSLDGEQLTEASDDALAQGGVGVAANDDSAFSLACAQVL